MSRRQEPRRSGSSRIRGHKAAEQLRLAQEQIENLRNEAQAWLDELRADTEKVWTERTDLVDDLRALAVRLQQAVSKSGTREQ
jgi:hypothetical protein